MDLTQLPRFGLKGTDIDPYLAGWGIRAGDECNRVYLQEDGRIVTRLAPNELLVLAAPDLVISDKAEHPVEDSHYCYRVPRFDTHYCFAVIGDDAPAMLAKLCGVDFDCSEFENGQVAQTRLARTSCVVLRHDLKKSPRFLLLGDRSISAFLWCCLLDSAQEFEYQVISYPPTIERSATSQIVL